MNQAPAGQARRPPPRDLQSGWLQCTVRLSGEGASPGQNESNLYGA